MVQIIILLITISLAIWYLNTLANTLKAINIKNRKITPMDVWMLMIPFFNYYYYFVVTKRLSQSIENELKSHSIPTHKPLYDFGIVTAAAFSINGITSILTRFSLFPEVMSLGISLVAITIWIIYWVQVAGFKKQLLLLPELEAHNDTVEETSVI